MKTSLRHILYTIALSGSFCLGTSVFADPPTPAPFVFTTMDAYKGKPFEDSVYNGGAQVIPGTILCAYYDLGGEGVAYHDLDAINHGSGELNKGGKDYLSTFRRDEGVDTSYTKFPGFDDSKWDRYLPPKKMLYVGWTNETEWMNYTVNIKEAGVYAVDLLHTAAKGGKLGLELDGKPLGEPFNVRSIWSDEEPTQWRNWHHWNYETHTTEVTLPKGLHVLTIDIVKTGNMNLGYLVFYPKPAGSKVMPVSDADAAPSPNAPK